MKISAKTNNQNKSRNKIVLFGFVLGIAAVLMLTIGVTLSYFTDRITSDAAVNTGSVELKLDDFDVNTDDVIAPGAIIPLSYKVSNNGSLALDERESITISVYKADGTTPVNLSEKPAEFEIYEKNDVEEVTGKGYMPKDGKEPVASVVANNQNVISTKQVTLDGSADELNDVSAEDIERDYVILFRNTASNDFMNCTIKLDLVVEAKQHAFSSAYDDDWTELRSASMVLSTGDEKAVVPAKNEE